MKLFVLSEAKAMDGFLSEHGLSFFLEVDGQEILFDTGASDVFLQNARKQGLDLNLVDRVVLSHGHWDHGNGLNHLSGLPLLCHPGCFRKRYRKLGKGMIGLNLDREQLEQRFEIETSSRPVQLSESLWFLGEVPRVNDFEARTTKYVLEDGAEDFITDDSGLVHVSDKGLVVISGCAHAGICNMVEYAREITGVEKVAAVLGGFHLKTVNEQTRRTIAYFKQLAPHQLIPSHCTMDAALEEFHRLFGQHELKAGMLLEF